MLAAQPTEDVPRRLCAAGLHVSQSLLNPFDGFDSVEEGLVGRRILDDEFGLAVDGQNEGVPGPSDAIEEIDGIAFELAERPNVIG
jgi:hypothetical protein